MRKVKCTICGDICNKHGKTKAGTQRWFCRNCKTTFSEKIDNNAKQLKIFLKWLFSRETQSSMIGEGRTFRRKTAKFWEIWPMPPLIESKEDIVYVDGIYLGRKACILICCNDKHVLGWYLCRYEHSRAWISLMTRISEPHTVVSDGGPGFAKVLRKIWPNAKHQRCLFHVFSQIKRYTTSRPKTAAGAELYMLSKDLLHIDNENDINKWTNRFIEWMKKYNSFLSQMTYDENGNSRPTHERLLKAQRSILRLTKEGTMFTYLDKELKEDVETIPSTNNRIEGGVNSRIRAMLRDHRGLSIERRIKAVFWWCYMHSPKPLSASEILDLMPTDKSISGLYNKLNQRERIDRSIPHWGDAVVWTELHRSSNYPIYWD